MEMEVIALLRTTMISYSCQYFRTNIWLNNPQITIIKSFIGNLNISYWFNLASHCQGVFTCDNFMPHPPSSKRGPRFLSKTISTLVNNSLLHAIWLTLLKFTILVYGDSDVITNPDDLLPPIAKLEKYAESDNIFNRSVRYHHIYI